MYKKHIDETLSGRTCRGTKNDLVSLSVYFSHDGNGGWREKMENNRAGT